MRPTSFMTRGKTHQTHSPPASKTRTPDVGERSVGNIAGVPRRSKARAPPMATAAVSGTLRGPCHSSRQCKTRLVSRFWAVFGASRQSESDLRIIVSLRAFFRRVGKVLTHPLCYAACVMNIKTPTMTMMSTAAGHRSAAAMSPRTIRLPFFAPRPGGDSECSD